jgi:hypothetical protein
MTKLGGGSGHSRSRSIVDHVGHDQSCWEEDKAEEKPRKLCPLRPATRAGQNAIAIQMMKKAIDPNHQPLAATSISAPGTEISFRYLALEQHRGCAQWPPGKRAHNELHGMRLGTRPVAH